MFFDPVVGRQLVQEIFVSQSGGDSLLISDFEGSERVDSYLPSFDFLLLGQSFLNLFLKLFFNLFGFGFVFLVILFEILFIFFKNLVALKQSFGPFFGLTGQILNFLLDDAMGHSDEEHFFFLFEDLYDGLIFAHEIFVFLPHLDDFQCVFY